MQTLRFSDRQHTANGGSLAIITERRNLRDPAKIFRHTRPMTDFIYQPPQDDLVILHDKIDETCLSSTRLKKSQPVWSVARGGLYPPPHPRYRWPPSRTSSQRLHCLARVQAVFSRKRAAAPLGIWTQFGGEGGGGRDRVFFVAAQLAMAPAITLSCSRRSASPQSNILAPGSGGRWRNKRGGLYPAAGQLTGPNRPRQMVCHEKTGRPAQNDWALLRHEEQARAFVVSPRTGRSAPVAVRAHAAWGAIQFLGRSFLRD